MKKITTIIKKYTNFLFIPFNGIKKIIIDHHRIQKRFTFNTNGLLLICVTQGCNLVPKIRRGFLRKMIPNSINPQRYIARLCSNQKSTKTVSVLFVTALLLFICYNIIVYSKEDVTEKGEQIKINSPRNKFVAQDAKDVWQSRYHIDSEYTDNDDLNLNCGVKNILSSLNSKENKQFHCSRLVYNRVPKCGSRSVLSTFKTLAKMLNYNVIGMEKLITSRNFYGKKEKLDSFVENFTEFQSPFLFSQHIHYINFTSYRIPSPIFINVIRDPMERQISHYYYNMYGSNNKPLQQPRAKFNKSIDECMEAGRGPCYKINEIIPFFCGHDQKCRVRDYMALQKAKRVAAENFLVIGFTEDLPAFMEVLEFVLPRYFFNASAVFTTVSSDLQNKTKTAHKDIPKPDTVAKLKEHLSLEYEFYNFTKQRFYNLLRRIRMIKSEGTKSQFYKNKRDFFKWWKNTAS